jgi:predicted RNA binding protein YcfA (HicA-like mRNA interferase family)
MRIKTIIKALESQGWRVELGGRHYKCFPPDKTLPMVVIAATPSDHRAWKNILGFLRRSGFNKNTLNQGGQDG